MADLFADMARNPEFGAFFLYILFLCGACFGGLISSIIWYSSS
jgi:hypothetical protein